MAYSDPEDQRAAERKWYLANKATVAAKKDRKRERLKELVRQAKSEPCADCGVAYPYWVMDFDHREGEDKEMLVSKLVSWCSLQRLLDEMAKCDVVCSNCHRERTHKRMRDARALA